MTTVLGPGANSASTPSRLCWFMASSCFFNSSATPGAALLPCAWARHAGPAEQKLVSRKTYRPTRLTIADLEIIALLSLLYLLETATHAYLNCTRLAIPWRKTMFLSLIRPPPPGVHFLCMHVRSPFADE